jgi:hypothetical protein
VTYIVEAGAWYNKKVRTLKIEKDRIQVLN